MPVLQSIYSTHPFIIYLFISFFFLVSSCDLGDPTSGGDCSAMLDKLLKDVDKIYSTGYAFAAVKKSGEVVTWGDAGSGETASSR